MPSSGKNHSGDIRPKPSTGDSNRGEKLYQASCIVCHGPGATGGIGPRLAGNPVHFGQLSMKVSTRCRRSTGSSPASRWPTSAPGS
ncbi:MAG: cytochrome c [Nitrospira sp.]|nr:cytochrome c [Nitrospira sp.]